MLARSTASAVALDSVARRMMAKSRLVRGGGSKASFGRRDTPGAGNGIPTVVFPAGYNDHGQPINIQLLGRAWDDAKLVGDQPGETVLTRDPPQAVSWRASIMAPATPFCFWTTQKHLTVKIAIISKT